MGSNGFGLFLKTDEDDEMRRDDGTIQDIENTAVPTPSTPVPTCRCTLLLQVFQGEAAVRHVERVVEESRCLQKLWTARAPIHIPATCSL
jgi:hypothetical protein